MISRHKISSSPTSVFLGKPENIGVLWNLVPTGIAIVDSAESIIDWTDTAAGVADCGGDDAASHRP